MEASREFESTEGQSRRHPPEDIRPRRGGIDALLDVAPEVPRCSNVIITRLMYLLWDRCPELRRAFDLRSPKGQAGYANWFQRHGDRPVPSDHSTISSRRLTSVWSVLARASGAVAGRAPGGLVRLWRHMRDAVVVARIRRAGRHPPPQGRPIPRLARRTRTRIHAKGINLIGYATGNLGLGHTVRSLGSVLARAGIPTRHLDFAGSLPSWRRSGAVDASRAEAPSTAPPYSVNVVVVAPDLLGDVVKHFGTRIFAERINVLYAFWELERWPSDWDPWLEMFDELWVPSRFVERAIMARGAYRVRLVPPVIDVIKDRAQVPSASDVAGAEFKFLVVVDTLSYLERKNPLGAAQAFQQAFPASVTGVRMVIKCANPDYKHPHWQAVMRLCATDPRIRVLTKYLTDDEMAELYLRADCFISLHRAEGFGLCLGEAMMAGKPVIATGYGGFLDITGEDCPLLVDYSLLDVPFGAYPNAEGARWADPHLDHAAILMRRVVQDRGWAARIAAQCAERATARLSMDFVADSGEIQDLWRSLSSIDDIESPHGVSSAAAG